MKKFISLIICAVLTISIFAQVPGTWNEFFSYNNVQQLAAIDDNIFALSENGLFVYNTRTQEIRKITKLQGLSDVGLTCMAFCDSTSSFLIGYSNGTLDVLSYPSLTVKNIPTIYQKKIPGSKRINKIVIHGDTAVLATGLGVFTMSMSNYNFISTTILSNDGSYTPVNSITIFQGDIYAATTKGIYSSNNTTNLSDFAQWKKLTGIPYENDTISYIASIKQTLYYAHKNRSDASKDSIFSVTNGIVQPFKIQLGNITNLHSVANGIALVTSYSAKIYDCNEYLKISIDTATNKYQRHFSDIVTIGIEAYISDSQLGIFTQDYTKICPKGPQSNAISDMQIQDSRLLTTSGKIINWDGAMFDYMDHNGNWYSQKTWEQTNARCVYSPKNSKIFYYGSFGGLSVNTFSTWWKSDIVYNHTNSCIQTHMYYAAPSDIISDITSDKKGNLWILNEFSPYPLISITQENKWYQYPLEIIGSMSFDKLFIDSRNIKWLAGESKLVAYYDNNTIDDFSDDMQIQIPLIDNEGTIASRTTCVAEDLNGTIWIGTDQGIAVHSSPARVFKDRKTISRIKIEIDGEVGYLLHSEQITCIAVDGANRKWIGTEKSGVFLVSDNGTEQILHFTKKNSPLPSNTITGLQINNTTGEVYIATDEGLVSYVTNATTGDPTMDHIHVYPNPVRNTYNGDIYITGVVADAIIKITDVSGNLVKTIQANGGTATWDGRNLYGSKVKTGMYLVYISNEEGDITKMTKLLFIN